MSPGVLPADGSRESIWDCVRAARGKSEGVEREAGMSRQWAITDFRALRKLLAKLARDPGV